MEVIQLGEKFEKFDNTLKKVLESTKKRVFVYFYGSVDKSTGKSWCPDTVKATPLVMEHLNNLKPYPVLIDAPVGDRKYWKENEDHPYKLNQLLKLKAIPTLMEFNKNLELVQKLVERECYDISKLEKFFENPSFVVDDDDDENCNIRACANCCIVS